MVGGSRNAKLSVFKGKEAKLNRAIFQVLLIDEPQAIWDIFKNISKLRCLKRKRYAVIEVRVKTLQTQGFLTIIGERETKQGNKTALFKITARAKLALQLDSTVMDELLQELDEEAALIILKAISKQPFKNTSC